MKEERYTLVSFWTTTEPIEEKNLTKHQVAEIVKFCLGETCVGFEIDLEEN